MTVTIRAHYDGKVIVPDEPVDLPIDQPLQVVLAPVAEFQSDTDSQQIIKERLERLRQAKGIISGPSIPLDALRRENLYEEARAPSQQRREALDRLVARAIHGLNIPAEALRRENLYEESL